jgi:hypothetical protein
VGTVALALGAWLLGAPWPSNGRDGQGGWHTALWAAQAAAFSTAPVAAAALPTWQHLADPAAWSRACFGADGTGRTTAADGPTPAVGDRAAVRALWALLGAWCGACLVPLDWGNPWLQWPLPLCYGTFLGHTAGCVAAGVRAGTPPLLAARKLDRIYWPQR